MTDRYEGGSLRDWEVTATITVPSASVSAAIHRAQEEMVTLKPGRADWSGEPA